MANLLAGKLGIVTGGGSGIGRAICERLAQQGARLVVVDLKKETAEGTCSKLVKDNGAHEAFACDVSKQSDVKGLVDFVKERFAGGSPQIVVNCAGITQDTTLLKMTESQFDNVVDVNLKGTFLITQAFARLAVEHQSPQSVVNISSIVGKVGNFGQTNYAATKAGVVGFSKSAARELAKKNIRVNCIQPGFVATPMTEAMPPPVLAQIAATIPMGRMGKPEEIADAVVYLASDLSSYVTGTTIEVTGGLGM
ncbi:hypothetical protein QR680_008267 [Steinernema hermaphroditum]|uniref:(3R)-3-hydroxyacyl-CoA dehydrogenase n=1 Tax=Steinernema hermaphroditum TaxID=289476 RepID=A0AA39IIB7_9BILA|nr:hypothetical protein QR680_008267 [Steinernema hermaphroditum]